MALERREGVEERGDEVVDTADEFGPFGLGQRREPVGDAAAVGFESGHGVFDQVEGCRVTAPCHPQLDGLVGDRAPGRCDGPGEVLVLGGHEPGLAAVQHRKLVFGEIDDVVGPVGQRSEDGFEFGAEVIPQVVSERRPMGRSDSVQDVLLRRIESGNRGDRLLIGHARSTNHSKRT